MTDSKREHRWRGILFVIPAVALWLIPIIVFVLASPFGSASESTALTAELPTTVTVGSRHQDARQGVTVTVALAEPRGVEVQSAGLITEMPIHPGDSIDQGSVLLRVNNIAVLAYRAPAPLYRELSIGSKGSDVLALSSFLAQTGVLPAEGVSDTFGPIVGSAVKKLQNKIGETADGIFRLSYVAFVPPDVATIGEVLGHLGQSIPTNFVMLNSNPGPIGMTVTAASTSSSLSDLAHSPLMLSNGQTDSALSGIPVDSAELPGLYDFLQQSVKAGLLTSTSPSVGVEAYSGATLRLQAPVQGGTVPATALATAPDGAFCLFVADSEGGTKLDNQYAIVRPTLTQPVTGESGQVLIDTDFIGKVVVRDPSLLPPETRGQCK